MNMTRNGGVSPSWCSRARIVRRAWRRTRDRVDKSLQCVGVIEATLARNTEQSACRRLREGLDSGCGSGLWPGEVAGGFPGRPGRQQEREPRQGPDHGAHVTTLL